MYVAGALQPATPVQEARAELLPQEPPVALVPHDIWRRPPVVVGQTIDDFVAIGAEATADASWMVRMFQSISVLGLQSRAQWRTIGAITERLSTLVNNAPKLSGG